ncbi:unnamed protein product [Paramecium octaurelia]|uniref:Uncharacterized protein n=1 Tax=Paramecium octaurelia TaxID=43137 RepID=A0A8S1SWM0_PAROT|nr:unnamed protein product [Paramecium octaurelia]
MKSFNGYRTLSKALESNENEETIKILIIMIANNTQREQTPQKSN